MTRWDERFLELAKLVASWSKDPSTKVGAVITDGNRVVSLGFNGFPAGVTDDTTWMRDREMKLAMTLHAEENAILFAQRSLSGLTIYCTHHPCAHCAAKIVQVGLKRVVAPPPAEEFADRWHRELWVAQTLLDEGKIKLELVNV